jgi:hypothetical protein
VHSDNRIVTERPEHGRTAGVTSWFHAQVPDFAGKLRFGTFLANAVATRIFCLAGSSEITPCTDLSTDCVDKGETRYES